MKPIRALFVAAPLLVALAGCHVPLQSYRINPPKYAPQVPTPTGDQIQSVPDDPKAKECLDASNPICISFVEVDDMGELWDKVELHKTLSLIRQANDAAAAEKKITPNGEVNDPIVVVFIPGWKNNASWGNDNVTGFMGALQVIYRRNSGKRHVIGVYVGWRGDLIPSYLPIARQLSLYNREATAIRIPGATLSSALTQIAMRTHENPDSLAIFVGHSFGALLLERTLSEMTSSQLVAEAIANDEADIAAKKDAAQDLAAKQLIARRAVDARADLLIFVNSAASATEAKQMLDFLTNSHTRYQPFAPSSTTAPLTDPAYDRPM